MTDPAPTPPAPAPAPSDPPAYTPPASQADLDRIISERLTRERSKFSDYNDLKAAKDELDRIKDQQKTEQEKLEERARVAEEKAQQLERQFTETQVQAALKDALSKRDVDPLALVGLNLAQFVKQGQVAADAITAFAEQFPEAQQRPKSTTFGQGARPPIPPSKGANGLAEAQRRFGGPK